MKHQQILNCFFTLSRTNALLSRSLSAQGLDFSDFMILYFLNEAPEGKLRRIDLAQKLGLSASGITRMILPLEKIGLVSRDLSDEDGRARFASLTEIGKTLLADAKTRIFEKMEDIVPAQQEADYQKVTALLEQIKF